MMVPSDGRAGQGSFITFQPALARPLYRAVDLQPRRVVLAPGQTVLRLYTEDIAARDVRILRGAGDVDGLFQVDVLERFRNNAFRLLGANGRIEWLDIAVCPGPVVRTETLLILHLQIRTLLLVGKPFRHPADRSRAEHQIVRLAQRRRDGIIGQDLVIVGRGISTIRRSVGGRAGEVVTRRSCRRFLRLL